MRTDPDLAVVFVHYHTGALLDQAVKYVRQEQGRSRITTEIVVVDNGSTVADRSWFQWLNVTVLEPGRNLGYAAGLNLGIRATTAPFVLAMNPDVLLLPGCLRRLLDALQHGAGAVGPRFYWDVEQTFQLPPPERRTRWDEILRRLTGYGLARPIRLLWRHRAKRFWQLDRPVRLPVLSGAALAFRRQVWERVGPFDERFHLYFEETDWLLRLKQRRIPVVYQPAARAVHLFNQSGGRQPQATGWFRESATRFAERYYGSWFNPVLDRLLPERHSFDEAPNPLERPDISLAGFTPPLWVEISPNPSGIPAAGCRLTALPANWQVPDAILQTLAPGWYAVRVVTEGGIEIRTVRFRKPPTNEREGRIG